MPFIIDVSGFEFIPIHDFVPNVQKNIFASLNAEGNSTQGDLVTFGDQRYISLRDNSKNNYTKDGSSTPN